MSSNSTINPRIQCPFAPPPRRIQAQAEGMTTDDLIGRLIKEVPEPTVDKYD